MESAESELENFRQQWRREVSARLNPQVNGRASKVKNGESGRSAGKSKQVLPSAPSALGEDDGQSGYIPVSFHDTKNKEDLLRLGVEGSRRTNSTDISPESALEHYEQAVEKEAEGRLGDSISLYRRALKLDPRAHEIYKEKHFPPSSFAPKPVAHMMSDASSAGTSTVPESTPKPPASLSQLLDQCSLSSIVPAPPETSLSPERECPIASIPEEILREIYQSLALADITTFARLAQVCKRLAYLVISEERIWKMILLSPEYGIPAMHYSYVVNLHGYPLLGSTLDSIDMLPPQIEPIIDLTPSRYPTYRAQFRHRPRLRFNGCYISTVNYTRPGAPSQSHTAWSSPIHVVTYYRYLRFYSDGTVISLLTSAEPGDVVHYLSKENLHDNHSGALPTAVMKDALPGRWRLSGSPSSTMAAQVETIDFQRGPGEYTREHWDVEDEGDVFVESQGVVPRYMWKMQFALGSAGRKDGTRNNKLSWKGYWSYNRLTDDWAEFTLKNDKAYYWSRVKSYGSSETHV